MKDKRSIKDIQEVASLIALDAMDMEESAVEKRLMGGEARFESELRSFSEVADQLGFATGIKAPPTGLKDRLFKRIEEASMPQAGYTFVRSNEGEWNEAAKGVMVKQLFFDAEKHYTTVLVKMEPGATFPDHRHSEAEECFVVSGQIEMGGQTFYSGDYIRADVDSIHHGIVSDKGCVLLVMASSENEIIA